jgi:hypothetical protein
MFGGGSIRFYTCDLQKIPHPGGAFVHGAGPCAGRTIASMKPITAAGQCNARVQRLVRVKFVTLPIEHTPPPAITCSRLARGLQRLRNSLTRVIGGLEAARP